MNSWSLLYHALFPASTISVEGNSIIPFGSKTLESSLTPLSLIFHFNPSRNPPGLAFKLYPTPTTFPLLLFPGSTPHHLLPGCIAVVTLLVSCSCPCLPTAPSQHSIQRDSLKVRTCPSSAQNPPMAPHRTCLFPSPPNSFCCNHSGLLGVSQTLQVDSCLRTHCSLSRKLFLKVSASPLSNLTCCYLTKAHPDHPL